MESLNVARARTIKPGFFKNEQLAECSLMARLLFAGLWCQADREGRLEDRPKRIKAEIFPYDNCDMDALLDELQQQQFIARYCIENSHYIQVLNFAKHQNPHAKETASIIPAPEFPEQAPEFPERAGPITLTLLPITHSAPPAVSPKRGTRLPTDWEPNAEDRGFAIEHGLKHEEVTAEFRDYWCAVAGSKGVKLDWSATYRNRCRELAKRKPMNGHSLAPRKTIAKVHTGMPGYEKLLYGDDA